MTVENLTKDISTETLSKLMDELAYTSKEAVGVRTPGERCMYEIQREKSAKKCQYEMSWED